MNKKHRRTIHRKIYRQRFGRTHPQISKCINGQWLKTMIRLIPWPTICDEIIGIMPMNGPSGIAFHLNRIP